MTDDPKSASPTASDADLPTASTPTNESAVSVTAADIASGEAETQKSRIKIGTQRAGVAVPRIEPRAKVAFRTSPPPTTIPAQSPSVSPTTPSLPEKQQTVKPFPRRLEQMVPPSTKIEKPNLRAPLSEELEAELNAALGDQSVEDLIAAETAAAAGAPAGELLEVESRHKGKVLRIFRDSVFIDLGGRNQGVLTLHQLPQEPEIGTMMDVVVTKFNAEDGLYELMLVGGSVDVGDWSDVVEGITVEARITGHNKGGLECEVNKIRGFIPAGQISLYRAENFEEFVGQSLQCVVVEANRDRRNLVLSHRAIMEREQAEAKQKILSELEVGQEREGIVRNLRDFGAFVDLGGIDGMVHVSQMSWDRVKHPSEVLTVGQKIKVRIQKIDPETHKISLAYRDLFESPWANAVAKYPVTSKVTGTVSKIMDFGAFVKLEPGIEGLVHVSELSYKRVHRVADFVQEGQQVEAKVLSVDPENQRISLSMKALEARPMPVDKKQQELEAIYAAQESAAAPEKKKQRKVPLQGGLGRSPMGDKFGLKW